MHFSLCTRYTKYHLLIIYERSGEQNAPKLPPTVQESRCDTAKHIRNREALAFPDVSAIAPSFLLFSFLPQPLHPHCPLITPNPSHLKPWHQSSSKTTFIHSKLRKPMGSHIRQSPGSTHLSTLSSPTGLPNCLISILPGPHTSHIPCYHLTAKKM